MNAQKQKPGNTQLTPRTSFLEAIERNLINSVDAQDALEYIEDESRIKNWKKGSIERKYQAIKPFLLELHRKSYTLATVDRKGVLGLIDFLQKKPDWSEDTKSSNWDQFMRYYKWAYRKHGGAFDPEAKNLILGDALGGQRWQYKRDHNRIVKKDTFTTSEMLELVAAEPHLEYKAFFGVTFEGGMRIGEALSLLIRDVEKTNRGYDLHIRQSKTEQRTVWVEKYFIPYLDKWLQTHPDKNNKNSKLFLNLIGAPLEQKAANKRLKERAAQLFPEKTKVSVHSLRHSWATETAGYLTEAQMCNFFGWRVGSNMPATYIRKQKVDVRRSMRQAHGLEDHTIVSDPGRSCLNCGHINPQAYDYCDQCKLPVDPERLAKVKQAADMEALLKNYVRQEFKDVIQQLVKEYKEK